MPLFRAVRPTLVVTSLVLAGTVPAAAATAPEEPITVVPLTATDGSLTGLADAGLERLQRSARSVRTQSVPDADDVAVLTAPIATEEFYVAGVTWDGVEALPHDAAVFIRVMEGGAWQDWAQLEVEAGADDVGTTGGTEPYIAAGAEAVQVQITGDAERLPANVRLSLTPEWPGEDEVVLEEDAPAAALAPSTDPLAPVPAAALPFQQQAPRVSAAPAAQATTQAATATRAAVPVPRPAITTRAGWGANESQMAWRPSYAPLRATVIHHTAGTNSYTQAQSPSIVRGIYSYHAITRGWGDIGYNFLIDKWGRIYEGRSGTLASATGQMPVGAHAAPFNTGTVGLSIMGDYTKVGVPSAAMNAMADILAWQFGRAGLTAAASSGMVSPGTYARPKGQSLGRVFAHRDVSATACPGDDIYSRMGWLARATDQRVDAVTSAPAPTPTPTPTTPAKPAAPAPIADPITHTGRVYLNNDWTPWSSVDFPLGDKGSQIFVGDWDGDGTDTLAIRKGNTFYVHGRNAAGSLQTVVQYGRANDEVLVGDWDGDGTDTFAVRRGKTFHVKNTISSGDADHVFVYGRTGDEVLVGDWDTDGEDTFAVRRQNVFHVKNRIAGGPADTVITYGRAGDHVLVGDWDGDGVDTFAVRRGIAYHVKNTISGGPADLVLNYGRRNDVVLVGDWDGDGTDTLGVHRP
ncbi:peptidoglycan recognition protein family protein [Georgenia satyanarayanai]|uniref:peptidoglycan recognition protein family protein n=1 Tax=Georgenia satyanarayanai TaxID=860221 RepID=UPI001264875D|nr:N-acetylmuramoyl-L-alanine amidase [Georgenia satyanarayanai]